MSAKRTFLITAALMTLFVQLSVQAQARPDQTVSGSKVVEAIKVMDRQWIIEAYGSKDLKDFDRIVAEDFVGTGANGKLQTKAQKMANVKADYTETWSPGAVFKIDEATHDVRKFGNTAISTGFIIEDYMYKTTHINGHVHFTNVYLKRNGRWQVVSSHFTNIKQP